MTDEHWLSRTELLIGAEKIEILKQKHVLVCGLGGVGSMAAEQLCRAGIGKLTLVDGDVVSVTNRNRQLPALISNTGKFKTDVMLARLKDINHEADITIITEYIKDQRMIDILEKGYDYVVDAIDTLSPKVYLLYNAHRLGLPVVSSMGAGGKFHPEQIKIADISESYFCKLAYYIRKRLHKLGVYKGIKVVFSPEPVDREVITLSESEINKKSTVGTISFMPAAFGILCASVVINEFLDHPES